MSTLVNCIRLITTCILLALMPVGTSAASNSAPGVAVYKFVSFGDEAKVQFATILSDVFMEQLARESWVNVLDRSLIFDVFKEQTLTVSQVDAAKVRSDFNKIPVSDYIVTGELVDDAGSETLVLKLVHADSGALISIVREKVAIDTFEESINKLINSIKPALVHNRTNDKPAAGKEIVDWMKSALDPHIKTQSRRHNIAFGRFVDLKTGMSDTRNQIIRNELMHYYVGVDAVQVLQRSNMYPLFIESYLKNLQYGSGHSNSGNVSADVLVDGVYSVDRGDIELTATIHAFGNMTIVRSFRDHSWGSVLSQLIQYLNRLVIVWPESISVRDRDRSEEIYMEVIRLANYRMRTWSIEDGVEWVFPDVNIYKKIGQQDVGKLVNLLNESLRLNPANHNSRLLLAYFLRNQQSSNESLENAHLQWLLLNGSLKALRTAAYQELRDFKLTPSAFYDVFHGDQNRSIETYRTLVNMSILTEEGKKHFKFDELKGPADLPLHGIGYGKKSEIYNIIKELERYPGIPRPEAQFSFLVPVMGLEAQYHLNVAAKLGEFEVSGSGRGASQIQMARELFEAGNKQRLLSLIDELASVIYVDKSADLARVFLAECLDRIGIGYREQAYLLMNDVLDSTDNEGLRYIAAGYTENIGVSKFSPLFTTNLTRSTIAVDQGRNRLAYWEDVYSPRNGRTGDSRLLVRYQRELSRACDFSRVDNMTDNVKSEWDEYFGVLKKKIEDYLEKEEGANSINEEIARSIKYGCAKDRQPQTEIIVTELDGGEDQTDAGMLSAESSDIVHHIEDNSQIAVSEIQLEPFNIEPTDAVFPLRASMLVVDQGKIVAGKRDGNRKPYVIEFSRSDKNWNLSSFLSGRGPGYPGNLSHATLDVHGNYMIIGSMYESGSIALTESVFSSVNILQNDQAQNMISVLFDKGYLDVTGRVTKKFTGNIQDMQADFPEWSRSTLDGMRFIMRKTQKVDDVGAAYVFKRDETEGWQPESQLFHSDAVEEGYFGNNVAIHDDLAVVCSTGDRSKNGKNGGAYVFKKQGKEWSQHSRIASGHCVAASITDKYIFVTIKNYQDGYGSVQIFERSLNDIRPMQTITSKNLASISSTGFGADIAADGNVLAISMPGLQDKSDSGFSAVGGVYLYTNNGQSWQLQQKLTVPDQYMKASTFAKFGTSLALYGNTLLVGAPGTATESDRQAAYGAAYLYRPTTEGWTLSQKISAKDAAKHDRFGAAVDISKDVIAIGSIRNDGKGKFYILNQWDRK